MERHLVTNEEATKLDILLGKWPNKEALYVSVTY